MVEVTTHVHSGQTSAEYNIMKTGGFLHPLLWRIYACLTDHMHSGAIELLIWSPTASIRLS